VRGLFVDTGAWYAIQVPNDRWHPEAVRVLKSIVAQGIPLVTTNLVVGETYTLLVTTHGPQAALRFIDGLERSTRLERAHLDEKTEAEGWALLRRYDDQRFSFVDATSFALMRRRRLGRAFAFDRHFAAAGFVRVPVDEPEP
jgi:uncharacterized protein